MYNLRCRPGMQYQFHGANIWDLCEFPCGPLVFSPLMGQSNLRVIVIHIFSVGYWKVRYSLIFSFISAQVFSWTKGNFLVPNETCCLDSKKFNKFLEQIFVLSISGVTVLARRKRSRCTGSSHATPMNERCLTRPHSNWGWTRQFCRTWAPRKCR